MQLIFEKAKRGYVGKIAFKCVNFGFACHIVTFSKRLSCGMSGECCPNIQNICSNTADSHSS